MPRALALALGLLVLGGALALAPPGALSQPAASFTGTIYRRADAGPPQPIIGAQAFVIPQAAPRGTRWIGPVLTDHSGRLVFNALDRGSYLLRVYVGTKKVWQDLIDVPSPRPYAVIVSGV